MGRYLVWVAAVALPWAGVARGIEVLASFYPMYVLTLNVVGDTPGVRVECLTEPFVGCLHHRNLRPSEAKRLSEADVLVSNGAGMETFLGEGRFPGLRVIDASEGIRLKAGGNPHVWVGISGAIRQVENIAKGLAEADSARAAAYRANAGRYIERLEALKKEMHAALRKVPRREIVTFHEAFPYFAEEFGLDVVAVIEREPGSQPSARELAETVETIRAKNVKAVFAEPQYSPRSAEVIRRETGVPVRYLDPVVTGPRDPAGARGAYEAAMRKNMEALQEALGG